MCRCLRLNVWPIWFSLLLCCFTRSNLPAQTAVTPASSTEVLRWDFEGSVPGTWTGTVDQGATGPRPPQYPLFAAQNRAASFGGDGAALVVKEADVAAPLRFGLGETITLEAWVRVARLAGGKYAYLIGKGRTRQKSADDKNQNYALRLAGVGGRAMINFLFSSQSTPQQPGDWHRWTSKEGFAPGSGWHHVAVTYTFGKPESIRGYVNGKVVAGTWDMGGATDRAPVQDADHLVIGNGNGTGTSGALEGALDQVVIHRGPVPEAQLLARYQRVRTTPTVTRVSPPVGKVLVEICEPESLGAKSWPEDPVLASDSYLEEAFGLFEVPHKYVDTGVRGDRANPYLLRASGTVKLPAGKHRLLLRGRGASNLYINDKLMLSTPFPPESSDGHHEIPKDYLDLGPDFRFAPPGNREVWMEWESAGGEHQVVLETIVGSYTGTRLRRPELGETVVAVSFPGESSWRLLSPAGREVSYSDAGWQAYEAERREFLAAENARRRAALRAEHHAYWQRRREAAEGWLAKTPEVPVPQLPAGLAAHNPIDHFLAVAQAAAARELQQAPAGGQNFHRQVWPLLQTKCLACHQGTKAKGGLHLDSLDHARRGGDSGVPAIAPGSPEKSELLARVRAEGEERMPPQGDPLLPAEVEILEQWIRDGAAWPSYDAEQLRTLPLVDDLAFLRRVTLDTVGVVPTLEEIRAFTADTAPDKRSRVIDRLLRDPRWADHWMGYWQDVLAENPNILNPTLNNSGPFRWWLYESLLDDKPMDLFVTELLRMRGSERLGGPAGFGVASQNDVPPAAKGTIVSTAFLGVEMKCARCHDAPYHESKQEALFQLGAMLAAKPLEVPKTSSVPMDKLHQGARQPLIQVTLAPGSQVRPQWPWPQWVEESVGQGLAEYPEDTRDRLAALITAPQNERFAQVVVNRIWQRYFGRGIVEPVDDWENGQPTHPELLRWLARELVRSGYQVKHIASLILNSHAYQRQVNLALTAPNPLYSAHAPRRLTAEQLVDSLFFAVGKRFNTEEINLDVDGQRDMGNSISLGNPRRSWMFASTSNERDRPSLSLPRVQAVVDVLAAFGWRPARQDPTSRREQAANILQPAVLANGTVSVWLTRLSDDHGITELALQAASPEDFVENLYLRLLTRRPTAEERAALVGHLTPGFTERQAPASATPLSGPRRPPRYVSWTNHLSEEANAIKVELEGAARRGDPPTHRLQTSWRERAEDVVWSLLNSPEWVFVP